MDTASAMHIHFPGANNLVWRYGFDVTTSDVICKVTRQETDPNLSFEAVSADFEYRVGQNVGMAVYRNYKIDDSINSIYADNGWTEEECTKDDIMRVFGKDNTASIYTGEITAVSSDKRVFRHSINAFRGYSGAIVFLLDKQQDLVDSKDYGKAIGLHVKLIWRNNLTSPLLWLDLAIRT